MYHQWLWTVVVHVGGIMRKEWGFFNLRAPSPSPSQALPTAVTPSPDPSIQAPSKQSIWAVCLYFGYNIMPVLAYMKITTISLLQELLKRGSTPLWAGYSLEYAWYETHCVKMQSISATHENIGLSCIP